VPDIFATPLEVMTEPFRQALDEPGICRRSTLAEAVVQMANDQTLEARPVQQMKKRHGIRPARYPDEVSAPLRSLLQPFDLPVQHPLILPNSIPP
jgi:hypothetical protein